MPEEKDLNDWMPILVACRNTLKYLIEKELAVPIGDTGLIEAMRKFLVLDFLAKLFIDTRI